MNKFFNYYNALCNGENSPNIFSFDPYLIAIKELLVSELGQIVFYIEKLKELNVDMSIYRDKVIDFVSILIVNLDFDRENFFEIIEDLYENKLQLENKYKEICKEQNIEEEKINIKQKELLNKENILKALNERERNSDENEINISNNKKILYQIMVELVQNACNCLIDLKSYDYDFIEAKNEVLKLFNISNFPTTDDESWINKIENFSKCNYKIMKKLYEKMEEKYGPLEKRLVPFKIKKGKAILVSGYNLTDLEKILEEVTNKDINIYTHNEIINGFQYKKLNENKKLVGHYQLTSNNFSQDFSSFPGPIYISKNSTPKIDVIRGQIYTSAKNPPYGIGKITNDNFSELIEYAKKSNGFKYETENDNITIGYTKEELADKINEIINKLEKKEISKICIIGTFDKISNNNEFVSKFFKQVKNECYTISFTKESRKENNWCPNSFYNMEITYKIIEELSKKIDNIDNKISIIFSDCNSTIISHIFNLKYLGINKIYLGICCPSILNPALINGLKNVFHINTINTSKTEINEFPE